MTQPTAAVDDHTNPALTANHEARRLASHALWLLERHECPTPDHHRAAGALRQTVHLLGGPDPNVTPDQWIAAIDQAGLPDAQRVVAAVMHERMTPTGYIADTAADIAHAAQHGGGPDIGVDITNQTVNYARRRLVAAGWLADAPPPDDDARRSAYQALIPTDHR